MGTGRGIRRRAVRGARAPTTAASFDTSTRLAALSRALGHPARLAIVRYLLARHGTCTCGDIVDQLPLAQSTVSQHLKVLKDAGWIRTQAEPPRVRYGINAEVVAEYKRLVAVL